jgi:hypothetical protein
MMMNGVISWQWFSNLESSCGAAIDVCSCFPLQFLAWPRWGGFTLRDFHSNQV